MHPLYSYARGSCIFDSSSGQLKQPSVADRESLMGFPAGYTSDLARRGVGSADPSGEYQRRSAVGNSFHLPSVALLYALLIAPSGAGALPIVGIVHPPSRSEQFEHAHQHALGSVFLILGRPPTTSYEPALKLSTRPLPCSPRLCSNLFHTLFHILGVRLLACLWVVFRISRLC